MSPKFPILEDEEIDMQKERNDLTEDTFLEGRRSTVMTHVCLLTFKPKNVLKLFSKLIIVGLVEVGLGRKADCSVLVSSVCAIWVLL